MSTIDIALGEESVKFVRVEGWLTSAWVGEMGNIERGSTYFVDTRGQVTCWIIGFHVGQCLHH